MSTCGCTTNSSILPIGPDGATGANGAQGLFGGFSGEWVFNTSTSTGPTSTQLRFNNSTYASVTQIYVSDTNADSIDYDAFLDSISNNGYYGYVRIFKIDDQTKFWMGIVTGVTDNGTDHTIDVTYISSNSSFTSNDAVVFTFSPAGADSQDGIYGGYSGEWIYDTSNSPTVPSLSGTLLRFNNNTASSVTEIYVNETGIGSVSYANFLASLDNDGSFGWIRIFKKFDSTKFWMGKITAVTDSGAYFTLTVEFTNSSNATIPTNIFADDDNIVLTFSPGSQLVANGQSSSGLGIALTITTPTAMTATSTAALAAGTYLFFGEFVLTTTATGIVQYRYYIDGVPAGTLRTHQSSVTTGITLVINEKLVVTAGQVVTVYMNYTTAGPPVLISQSIQYIKIA